MSSGEVVTVKFDGQSHQVDLDTFTHILINYSTVIQAAAAETGVSGDVRVSICAIESGSLDVLVSVASGGLGGLLGFVSDNSNAISGVLAVASGLYGLKQKLAGKGDVRGVHAGDNSEVIVSTDGGDVTVDRRVFNVYVEHPEATRAIDSSFSKMDEHPEIEGFQISHGGDTLFRAEHDEFSGIAASCNHEGADVRVDKAEGVTLIVTKPFLGKSKTRKWEFFYRGNKVTAPIVDDDFMDGICRYSFKVGTEVIADIEIEREFLSEYKVYANRGYRVTKVHSVKAPPETEQMP